MSESSDRPLTPPAPHPGDADGPAITPTVGIVGAGIAGLVCARTLADRGVPVTVLDKGRRPGGRLATRHTDGWQFDHGAQFFTARDSAFRALVNEWRARGLVAPWEGRFVTLGSGGTTRAADPVERLVGVPSMQALAADLASGLRVRSEVRVARLAFTDAAWHVYLDDGSDGGEFDYVVLAIPAPQAAMLVEGTTLALDARSILMAPCWTVLVGYPSQLDVPFDGAFIRDTALAWAARDSSKPGRPARDTWVLQASPEWSMMHLEEAQDTIRDALVGEFVGLTGAEAAKHWTFATAHRWRFALATLQRREPLLFDADLRIGLCGDWCGGARIEGAFLSGRAMATRLLEIVAGSD